MRFIKAWLIPMVIVLALSMLLSGCGQAAKSGEDITTAAAATTEATTSSAETADPFGKYDPAITINLADSLNPQVKYQEGEDYRNNIWTKAYEEELGIKFNYIWTATVDQYEERFNVALASDDLPDILEVNFNQFYKLGVAGKLADITEAFEKYASPLLKQYATSNDSFALRNCTIDGKLQGLATAPDLVPKELLWIRDDWMKNLNLEAPKTVDDVLNIARAFAKQDPDKDGKPNTVGLGIDKELWDIGGMSVAGLANGYHAYPKIWIEKDGKLEYGSIQPEMKTFLTTMQGLFKDGVIDKEFTLLDSWDKAAGGILSGKIGMMYSPDWAPFWKPQDYITEHPEATWSMYPIPSADDKPALSFTKAKLQNAICVTSKCKNPEALIKMANFVILKMFDPEKADGRFHNIGDVETFPYAKILDGVPSPDFWSYQCAIKVVDALNTGDASKLNPEQKDYYDRAKKWVDSKDPTGWPAYAIFGPGGSMIREKEELVDKKLVYVDKYTGPDTDTMISKKANLEQKENEIFTKIIMGASVEDEFNKWVEYFNAQGGVKITEEVNQWWDKQAK